MAGRIRDEDIALVRERARIDDIVREYVTLKGAGGGSLKGLCPFHDERSPSFHVTPSRGMWYCFGCGEGGDVLGFVQKIDHLSFAETVEKLAQKTGVELRYVEGSAAVNRQQGQRTRLVEAHKVAAQYYMEQLATPDAQIARTFLAERGFDAEVARKFGVGYAPKSWDALTSMLRNRGFTDAELLTGGLLSQGNRGVYDRFRGRLVWPIRELSGDVVGFGARRLYDDDDGPKYLNTPESPIYKKGQVLYGLDLARKDISKQQQAVIVEGYTDVMACHLAGFTTAVATCGTAFGSEHIRVLRRLLMDDDQMRGEVVFTFDGDAAGQKAALRAFDDDQRFVAQTFVAIEPSGMDPCDLRLAKGDEAVVALVDRRVPLFQFAIRSTLAVHDLDSAEGRIAALRDAAPIVAKIKDPALRPEYTRLLAGWLGLEIGAVQQAVARPAVSKAAPGRPVTTGSEQGRPTSGGNAPTQRAPQPERSFEHEPPGEPEQPRSTRPAAPVSDGPAFTIEREALKCALQLPGEVEEWYPSLEPTAFTHPRARAVHEAVVAAGLPNAARTGLEWMDAVLDACADDEVRRLVKELSVDPLPSDATQNERYATSLIARLLELDAARRIADVRGRLQRADAGEEPERHQELFAELLALEDYKRSLHATALGEKD